MMTSLHRLSTPEPQPSRARRAVRALPIAAAVLVAGAIAFGAPAAAFADPKDASEIPTVPGGSGTPVSNGCPKPTPPAGGGGIDIAPEPGVNTAPIVWGDQLTAVQNHPLRIRITDLICNDRDAEHDVVYLNDIDAPVHGWRSDLSAAGGTDPKRSVVYMPDEGYVGSDALMYDIVDEHGAVAPYKAAAFIQVVPQKAPVTVPDAYTTTAGTLLTVTGRGLTLNDTDAEKDGLTTTSQPLFGPAHGTVTLTAPFAGGFRYTPAAGFVGSDSFFYRVTDNHGGTSKLALVTITVKAKSFTAAPAPVVSGSAVVGQKLTLANGSWAPSPAFAYQWKRNGVAIPGATAKSYTAVTADAGAKLSVTTTATKSGYSTVKVTSASTATVTGGVMKGVTPIISGTTQVGQKLTATAPGWAPSDAVLAYQWKRNGAVITGSTSKVRLLTVNDAGAKLTVTVTATRPGYTSVSKTSLATAAITKSLPPVPNAVPNGGPDAATSRTGAGTPTPASPAPVASPAPKVVPGPTGSPAPTDAPAPKAVPTDAPAPTAVATPKAAPVPTAIPTPKATPVPTVVPSPKAAPKATSTSAPSPATQVAR
ncbi:MAG: Ig-like domain-containing protein [Herbiconiux sp.]|nr:Ig-like domain-containing protein [Herbiconiux sp.]